MKMILGFIVAFVAVVGVVSAQDKVQICHTTSSDTNETVLLSVGDPAVATHLEHGDTLWTAEEGCGGGGPDPV